MRAVVTGGSGFVGTNLIDYLVSAGWDIVNFDIAPPRNAAQMPWWREVDILDRARLLEETRGFQPEVFVHLAARTDLNESNNLTGYAANVDGVRYVVDAIQHAGSVSRAVFASSQLVCRLGYMPRDEYDYCPTTLYGLSKTLTERIVRAAGDMCPTWTIVRPTSLWGPWFDVPYLGFFQAVAANRYVHPGDTRTPKQWGFIGNVVYQVVKLLEAPGERVHGRTFYLADYEAVDLHEFANKVRASLGARPIRHVPEPMLKTAARVGDVLRWLGWGSPPLTSFRYKNLVTPEVQDLQPLREIAGSLPFTVEQGIQMTLEWMQGQRLLPN